MGPGLLHAAWARSMYGASVSGGLIRLLRCAQVAERVRTDARVAVLERTNLRYLTLGDMPDQARCQLATLDLSFISVLKACSPPASATAPCI